MRKLLKFRRFAGAVAPYSSLRIELESLTVKLLDEEITGRGAPFWECIERVPLGESRGCAGGGNWTATIRFEGRAEQVGAVRGMKGAGPENERRGVRKATRKARL